jgi:hypothetical protein
MLGFQAFWRADQFLIDPGGACSYAYGAVTANVRTRGYASLNEAGRVRDDVQSQKRPQTDLVDFSLRVQSSARCEPYTVPR